ncbi:MAG: PASTA domain-containing protein [Lachnospiraceae bacterium]|nr:PASTA domain-containing protein [Lachnospiraceae bacterium]
MSEKYSKREIENLLRQTSASLTEDADARIRRNLAIRQEATSQKPVVEEETHRVLFGRRGAGRRLSFRLAALLVVVLITAVTLLTVWIHSYRKETANGKVTPTATPTPTPTLSPTLPVKPTVPVPEKPSVTPTPQDMPSPTPPPPAGTPTVPVTREQIVIPDFRNYTQDQVREALDDKLLLRIDWAASDTVEENHVIETQPKAGESVSVGSTLILVLSQGNSDMVSVPNVVGKKEIDAKAILTAAKLNYTTESVYSDTVEAGVVVSQTPDETAGKVTKGSAIRLYISAGEDPSGKPTPEIKEGDVPITKEYFPDDLFRERVREYDVNQNGVLEQAEAAGCTSMYLAAEYNGPEEKKIRSLRGIEYFTEIRQLNCSWNAVTELDLRRQPKLDYLDCSSNGMLRLDVSGNKELTHLDARNNKLTVLDLSNNTKLTELALTQNDLTSLDVSKNTKLTQLSCEEMPIRTIDLSNNKALTELAVTFTEITELDLTGLTKLEKLYCFANKLEKLTVDPKAPLVLLFCYDNQLATFDFGTCPKLEHVICYKNRFKELDVSGNAKLKILNCSENPLEKLVLNNPEMTELDCHYCELTKLDVSASTKLERLWIQYNEHLREIDVTTCTKLSEVRLNNSVIVHGRRDETTYDWCR